MDVELDGRGVEEAGRWVAVASDGGEVDVDVELDGRGFEEEVYTAQEL